MRLALRIALIVWILSLAAGCARFNVRSDWDREARFDTLENYAWLEPPKSEGGDPFADNSLMRKRVRVAIETALADRGYRQVDEEEGADFIVTWAVVVDDRLRVDDAVGVGVGGYWGWGYGGAVSTPSVRNYQESTLVIDVLDPTSRDIAWRGWGTGIVGTRDRDRGEERLAAGVNAILDKFPPRR